MPCKHDDLNLIPSTLVKSSEACMCQYPQGSAGLFRQILWTCWPASLAKTSNSRLTERLCLKTQGGEPLRKTPAIDIWPPYMHRQVGMHTYTPACTHTTHVLTSESVIIIIMRAQMMETRDQGGKSVDFCFNMQCGLLKKYSCFGELAVLENSAVWAELLV